MSVFLETNHLLGRKPSDVGEVAKMRDAGFGAIFCNVGDYPADEWGGVREQAKAAGIRCGPWLRTADANTIFDPDRLLYLIDTADEWDWAPLVCNSEKEIDHTGADLTRFIAQEIGDRDAAISTEVRPFGAVDWKPLAGYAFLPQNFPAETGIMDSDATIRMNWYAAGAVCVAITYGSYAGMRPADFERLTPYGVYTADDCGNDFQAWAPRGSCSPCRENGGGDDMTLIGSQHGITAMANVWREQWPDKTKPNRKPDDLSTWGAIDKIERTLLTLAEDHDAQEKGAA
jgi:hypothetical protein